MRQLTAFITVVLLTGLGFTGIGNAQTQQVVQMQGTIQAVDCQNQELTLTTSGGATTFAATSQTAVYVNGTPAQLCALQSDIGAPATVSVVPSNSEFVLGQVNVTAPQAAAQPTTATAHSSTSSVLGIAVGALLLAGVAYLIGHNSANNTPAPAPASNWYDEHQAWNNNCTSQPGPGGQWGRQAQMNNWCAQNQRFRNGQPDQQWNQQHPWDHGRASDSGGPIASAEQK